MICLVVVLNPFSQECLAVAIRRVLVEEMMKFLLRHEVTLEQIFNEDEIEISAMLSAPCESCNGSGAKSPDLISEAAQRVMEQTNRATGPSRTLYPTNEQDF